MNGVRPASSATERREELKPIIRHIFGESDETYGYRRVRAELARLDVSAGPELVRALMREMELVPISPVPGAARRCRARTDMISLTWCNATSPPRLTAANL
jgi:hypothetical protein